MTDRETLRVLAVLRAAYPRFYAGITDGDIDGIAALWQELFAQDDYRIVTAAVKALICGDEKGFPPVPGQVKARIRQITRPQEMTEGEAWALGSKAIRNSAYESGAEFGRLPAGVQRIVGSPSQLRDWGAMDSGTVHSVVASNFQRAFRSRQERDRAYAELPPDVKALIHRIASCDAPEALPDSGKGQADGH